MAFHILGIAVLFAQCIRPYCPYSNHHIWSFPVGLELPICWVGRVFKALLKTNSLALNVRGFTCRFCKIASLQWCDAMLTATASQSSSVVSRSLVIVSTFTSSGIYVRMVGISISMGMIAFISYVRANGDSPVGF